MSLRTADYDYALPARLIAIHPPPRREDARMMVLSRTEKRIEHRCFAEFPSFLREGDLVVLNNTRVLPARVFSDDRRIELLRLEAREPALWKCLVKPGRRMRVGATVRVGGIEGRVEQVLPEGERLIRFEAPVDLDRLGVMPLPPYIDRPAEESDTGRYQTVFAEVPGAIAAPTAGLHFTPEILAKIPHAFVTLHVGAGTFKPVAAESLAGHRMHGEQFSISAETASAVQSARRIVAIGTTTVRVLESWAQSPERMEGSTDIFIHPPFEFRWTGALLTNFHLPKSTLLMLVSAFAGREFVLEAYAEAIRREYRFYSYGDCMLIV